MIKKIKTNIKNRKQRKQFFKNFPSAYDKAVMSWTAPEYIQHEKGKIWKITALSLVIISAVLGYFFNALTFSIAIIVFAFVYYLVNSDKAKLVEVVISEIGIKVGNRNYPYSKIRGFWIIYDPPRLTTLNIWADGEINSHIVIQLNELNPAEIREYLIKKIPEMKNKKETMVDIFTRLLRI